MSPEPACRTNVSDLGKGSRGFVQKLLRQDRLEDLICAGRRIRDQICACPGFASSRKGVPAVQKSYVSST